jgi:general secretion pathway protein H
MPILQAGRRAPEAGYTLLEMLVVLALVGLGTAGTGYVIAHHAPGLQLKASSTTVAALMRQARSEAIRDNRERRVILDLVDRTAQVDTTGKEHVLDGVIGMSVETAASELQTERHAAIRFFPDGTSTGGRVTLLADAQAYEIRVNWLTGNVEVNEDVR